MITLTDVLTKRRTDGLTERHMHHAVQTFKYGKVTNSV